MTYKLYSHAYNILNDKVNSYCRVISKQLCKCFPFISIINSIITNLIHIKFYPFGMFINIDHDWKILNYIKKEIEK